MRAGINLQAQSILNLKKKVGQLASSIQTLAVTVKKSKFSRLPVPNPNGVHKVSASLPQQLKEIKTVITLRKGKEVDNKVEMLVKKTTHVIPLDSKESSPKEKGKRRAQKYILKAPFPQRLTKVKKGNSTSEL